MELLFLLLSTLTVSWGQQVFLSLGSTTITTNNTEILITDIGENAIGGSPSLTCNTDLTVCCRTIDTVDGVSAGEWYYPDGSIVPRNPDSQAAGQQFYRLRNAAQVLRLARRQTENPLGPTGSYCCEVPTTQGNMTFCANLVVCESLTLANGMISYSNPTLGVDSIATHICDSGYDLSGGSNPRTCGSNGRWSGPDLTCVPVTCPDLAMPANGMIMYSGDSRRVGTVATYSCNSDYTLSSTGDSTRTCQSDGMWSGSAPTCEPTPCIDLPSLTNGMISYDMPALNNRPVGTTATHTCNTGFALSGTSTRTCELGNTWSGAAPTCEVLCSDLTMPANGGLSYNLGAPNNRPVGTEATYSCSSGYDLNGGTNMRTCQSDRSWTGSPPTCQAVDCGSPPDVTNADRMSTGTTLDQTATYSCNTGYQLSGPDTVTCQASGNWETPPMCNAISCGFPPSISNGSPGTPTSTTFGGTASYSCDNGFIHDGSSLITCQADGSWSVAPSCVASPPVYLSLQTTNYITANGQILISSIDSTDASALLCQTDLTTCCRAADDPSNGADQGEWLFPDGTTVPDTSASENSFFSSQHTSVVRLHQRGTVDVTGSYCCRVPTSQGEREFCVELVEQLSRPTPSPECISYDNTGAVIGGVVAVSVISVSVAVAAVLITHLLLRQRRSGGKPITNEIQLDDRGQSSNTTYEVVDAAYEEIPPASGSTKVKGDYEYTQNEAYTTTPSGRGHDNTTATEGIYDN